MKKSKINILNIILDIIIAILFFITIYKNCIYFILLIFEIFILFLRFVNKKEGKLKFRDNLYLVNQVLLVFALVIGTLNNLYWYNNIILKISLIITVLYQMFYFIKTNKGKNTY